MKNNTRLCSVISYITWIGWVIALFLRDRDDSIARRHLNQALVINIIESVFGLISRMGGVFGIIGTVVDVACLVLFIMGVVRAFRLSDEPLPIIGGIDLIA